MIETKKGRFLPGANNATALYVLANMLKAGIEDKMQQDKIDEVREWADNMYREDVKGDGADPEDKLNMGAWALRMLQWHANMVDKGVTPQEAMTGVKTGVA